MARVKFYKTDFLNVGNIKLKTVISMSNKKQTGDDFAALVDQVIISYPVEINHFEIILTTELYRHYYGEKKSRAIADSWMHTNQAALDKLKQHNIPYTISSWVDFLLLPNYQQVFNIITSLYHTDECFYRIVNDLADLFSKKMAVSIDSAKDFLLEECCIARMLTGYIAYPHKELNTAISYALTKLSQDFIYIAYKLINHEGKTPTLPNSLNYDHPLYQQIISLKTCFEQHGIKKPEDQISYFSNFLRGLHKKEAIIMLDDEVFYAEKKEV